MEVLGRGPPEFLAKDLAREVASDRPSIILHDLANDLRLAIGLRLLPTPWPRRGMRLRLPPRLGRGVVCACDDHTRLRSPKTYSGNGQWPRIPIRYRHNRPIQPTIPGHTHHTERWSVATVVWSLRPPATMMSRGPWPRTVRREIGLRLPPTPWPRRGMCLRLLPPTPWPRRAICVR